MIVRIGITSMAHMHAYSYASAIKSMPDAELVGIADHDLQRAHEAARQFETRPFPSYEALLEQDIHAVVIGSDNVRHRALCELAADAD